MQIICVLTGLNLTNRELAWADDVMMVGWWDGVVVNKMMAAFWWYQPVCEEDLDKVLND